MDKVGKNLSELDISILANDWIIEKKDEIITKENETLNVNVSIDRHLYLTYKEKPSKFDIPPKENNLKLEKGQLYTVGYNATLSGSVSSSLYLIGYSDNEKIQTEVISCMQEKTIKINRNCTKFRLAIRISGTGKLKLEYIKIKLYNLSKNTLNKSNKNIKNLSEIKIACIVDYFTNINLSKEFKLIKITPNNWIQQLEKEKPNILLVESAWKGNDGAWQYKIGKYSNIENIELKEVVKYCNENYIPTVFWNKEDPVHFNKFIDSARIFDYIFTTDRNMIKKYKEASEHDNVYELPFAAQPSIHNPIKKYERINGICFAGSFYANRHEERRTDMEELLDICKKYNLCIYDRNYNSNKNNQNSHMKFPERFTDNILGTLDYTEIDKAYKGYKVSMNVNSVKNSPTMFSRRVFECLACGTPVISTYSLGIDCMFKDIVLYDKNKENLDKYIEELFEDKFFWKYKSLKGIREVMLKHTYKDRFVYMLSKLGIELEYNTPKVSCIMFAYSMSEIQRCIKLFENQEYICKELIIIINSDFDYCIDALNNYNRKNIKCFLENYVTHNYYNISEFTDGDYLAYFNIKNEYGKNYLLDLVLATKYVNAEVIGKGSYYKLIKDNMNIDYEELEYTFIDKIKSDRCLIKTTILDCLEVKELLDLFYYNRSIQKSYAERYRYKSINNERNLVKKLINKFRILMNNTEEEYKNDFDFKCDIFSVDNNNFIEVIEPCFEKINLNKIFF